ncbi:unnamed protein product [Bursaphelenchus xylophilus]|uniref:Choline transporter-like protein n=1 Tax=Bursaphelenchus xylophilus TaxID=6326 RepID=A0A1I7RTZ5_BURXY|nr:unnamed protein product [Bursaphelenchus xylophilus]CAG9132069.1 unnamed protein product [Bursaphelenchus xylophilus]
MVRRSVAVAQKGTAPPLSEYYLPAEPVYNEIDVVPYKSHQTHQFPQVPRTTRRPSFHGVGPILPQGHNFALERPPVQPIVGQRAAHFELQKAEKLLSKNPEKAAKKPFNPIVLTRRGCTDVPFCMLFILYIFGWAFVAFIAYNYGKPERILYPTDSWGNSCGKKRPSVFDTSEKPYLYFFDLTKCVSYTTLLSGCPTPQMCVSRCPTKYWSYVSLARAWSVDSVQQNAFCDYTVDVNSITTFNQLQTLVKTGKCAAYTVPSSVVLGRCVPEVIMEATNAFKENGTLNDMLNRFGNDANGLVVTDSQINETVGVVKAIASGDGQVLQKVVVDLGVSWWQILSFLGIAAVVSFVWTLIMRIMGGFMIWLSIFLLLIGLGGGTWYCFNQYQMLIKQGAINDYSFQPILSVYFEMPNTWLTFAIILGVLLVIIFLGVLFIRTRVSLAVALIGESSKALGSMLSTLFFPIFPFAVHIAVFALWGSVAIWLASIGTENCVYQNYDWPEDPMNNQSCNCQTLGTLANCRFLNLTKPEDQIAALQAYNLFGLFWMTCFISALSDMTIAGAFASYYFAFRKPKDVPSFPVLRSAGRAIRFHMGTLALGSMLLSFVKMLQVILDFVYNKLKNVENPVGKAIYRALTCLFWCLEKILRFLSKNAYIMTAIYGKGFCTAARDSFTLLTRNLVRVVVLNRVTAFLLFIGKALITCGMGALAFYYFTGQIRIDDLPQVKLHYYFVPVIIVIIGTYFICDLFFQVYDMGVDTTFLCFLEDSEANDGSPEKPFYMSDELKRLLGKENKF